MRHAVAALLFALALLSWGARLAPARAEAQPTSPKESAELTALRQQYMAKALGSARTLSEQYSNALLNVEHEAAASGDYEQALTAQRRRLEITETYKSVLGDIAPSNAIVLHPADATLNGGVFYDKTGETLIGWRKAGAIAEWDTFRLLPGAYQVSVIYSVGDGTTPHPHLPAGASPADNVAGGDFEFYEDSTLMGADTNHRNATVESKPAQSWSTFVTLQLEPLHLQRTSARFVLHCTKVKGGGGLMCLKEIRLTPVQNLPAAVVPEPATPGDALTQLQQSQLQHLKAIAQPICDSYLASLATLGLTLTTQQDTDGLAALTMERSRVQKWLANPATPTPARSSAFRSALNSAGLAVVAEDARFVPDATNSGDRFRVNQDGKDFIVRLMWVSCPPPNADNLPQLDYHARYFGITPEDTEAVGKEAQDFSASLLADKPLRILSSGQRDKDEHLFAMVVPEGMEDLASVLVDNGLAAVNPSVERKPSSKRYETNVLKALKDRETASRQRPIPPGAWAYAAEPAPHKAPRP